MKIIIFDGNTGNIFFLNTSDETGFGSVRRHGHRILKEKFFSIIFEFPIVFVCKTVSTLGQEVWDLQFLIVGRCFPPN